MPHLPKHNYFGPGTDLKSAGESVDIDDDIAKEHDEAYEAARSREDVHRADRHAINDFVSDFFDNWNTHSLIGASGLAVKHSLDLAVGQPIYGMPLPDPKRMKLSRNHQGKNGNADISSNAQTASSFLPGGPGTANTTLDVVDAGEGGTNPPTADPAAGLDKDASLNVVPMWSVGSDCDAGTFVFNAEWMFTVPSFRYEINFIGPPTDGQALMCTPHHIIPADDWSLYMSPAQWDALPRTAYAVKCAVEAVPLEFRTPFTTNTTSSGFANANLGVKAFTSVGMNKIFPSQVIRYKPPIDDTTKPVPDGSPSESGKRLEDRLWGAETGTGADIPAVVGIPRHINQYLAIQVPREGGSTWWARHGPSLGSCTDNFIFNDAKNKPMLNYSYTFKYAPLKAIYNYGEHGDKYAQFHEQFEYNANCGFTFRATHCIDEVGALKPDLVVSKGVTAGVVSLRQRILPDNFCELCLEKSSFISPAPSTVNLSASAQPLPAIGLVPTLSSKVGALTHSYADIISTWRIKARLVVRIPMHTYSPADLINPHSSSRVRALLYNTIKENQRTSNRYTKWGSVALEYQENPRHLNRAFASITKRNVPLDTENKRGDKKSTIKLHLAVKPLIVKTYKRDTKGRLVSVSVPSKPTKVGADGKSVPVQPLPAPSSMFDHYYENVSFDELSKILADDSDSE